MAACAAGLYVGMAVAGFGGLVTGHVRDLRVLYAAPFLAGIGALVGLWAAHATRRWLLAKSDNRKMKFAVASAAMMPFAVCVSQLPQTDDLAALVLLPGCVTGGLYLLTARRARHHTTNGRAEQARLDRENAQLLNELLLERLADRRPENTATRRYTG